MRVYLKTGRRDHLMFITPGLESEVSDFFNEDMTPRQFTIRFVEGVADVASNIGRYLIDKGVAQTTSIIEPAIAAQMAAQDERLRNHRILDDNYHG